MKFYYFFIFSFIFYFVSSEPLKIPFKTRFKKENMNKDNVMQMLINNDIIANISIGSNNQTIEVNIKSQKDSSFILSDSCPQNIYATKFNANNSETYEKLLEKKNYYMYEFDVATLSKDNLILMLENDKKVIVNDFKFMLANNLWNDFQKYMGGVLGLILSNKVDDPKDTDFITQLKSNQIINSYVFMLDYKDNYNGIFLVGDYFHDFDNHYNEKDFMKMNAGKDKEKYKIWEIKIDKVLSKNQSLIVQNNTYLQMHYEMGIFASPDFYHNYIKENFFNKYLDEGICAEILNLEDITIFNKYNYIVCNKTNFQIESFPDLIFFNSEINHIFTFNYKDLFYEFENRYYFLVVFPIYSITVEYWYVGKPFFVKYKLFFDKDKKMIGLYENDYQDEEGEEQIIIENSSNFYIVYIIIIIILIIILIGVLYYFLIIKRTRKKRANELEENIDYSPYSDEDKNKKIIIN